ncbi:hypothetical protein [Rhizobium leguminosarum]|uniref:hypothetical protein n=1 Tax=Rhizobium leguminosarum TaxID=384 RepID=UPI001C96E64F|nr:hypothetical protein [Rhizobium leguminosarum]MBY5466406.1 hypothetical protein [Rhizobium leguminosarum]MBY5529389.1 hypothetical protein [Rhizobium leguminosarum]
MQPFLIEPSRAYLSGNANRPSYASRIENGAVAYREFHFGIAFSRTDTLDEFAKWAHEDVELIERREVSSRCGRPRDVRRAVNNERI